MKRATHLILWLIWLAVILKAITLLGVEMPSSLERARAAAVVLLVMVISLGVFEMGWGGFRGKRR